VARSLAGKATRCLSGGDGWRLWLPDEEDDREVGRIGPFAAEGKE
jgi:hypothetical protein